MSQNKQVIPQNMFLGPTPKIPEPKKPGSFERKIPSTAATCDFPSSKVSRCNSCWAISKAWGWVRLIGVSCDKPLL